MFEFKEDKYEPKEITFISWDGSDLIEKINSYLETNYPDFDVANGERLEIKIEISVHK